MKLKTKMKHPQTDNRVKTITSHVKEDIEKVIEEYYRVVGEWGSKINISIEASTAFIFLRVTPDPIPDAAFSGLLLKMLFGALDNYPYLNYYIQNQEVDGVSVPALIIF